MLDSDTASTDNLSEQEDVDTFNCSSSYTDNFPKILRALNFSLAVTSYQAQRLMLVRCEGDNLQTHFKYFPRPMGVYADEDRITLGTLNQVLEFRRSDHLLENVKSGGLDNVGAVPRKLLDKDKEAVESFQKEKQQQLNEVKAGDSLYIPRAALTTGMINIHDIAWGEGGLWVVNSTFSCLSTLSPDYSFVARWQPYFINELVPEDRCHLNGMALDGGRPRYVTTFSRGNVIDAWFNADKFDGTLMDVEHNEILVNDLIMPHSPRAHRGAVYVCNSGKGEVLCYHPESGRCETLLTLPGFTRGLYFLDDLMIVATSKIRKTQKEKKTPIHDFLGEENSRCGVWLFDLNTLTEVGHLCFEGDVEQIYDIAVVPGSVSPVLLTDEQALVRHLFDFSQETF